MKTNRLKDEAAAFDLQIRERIAHGHVPDLRRAQPCDWFYNNPWRRPEYIDSIFGEDFRFALAQIPPGSRILEVGSGPGHMALEPGEPDRAAQERREGDEASGGQSDQQLGVHGDGE